MRGPSLTHALCEAEPLTAQPYWLGRTSLSLSLSLCTQVHVACCVRKVLLVHVGGLSLQCKPTYHGLASVPDMVRASWTNIAQA